jgi:hypothetical protein
VVEAATEAEVEAPVAGTFESGLGIGCVIRRFTPYGIMVWGEVLR